MGLWRCLEWLHGLWSVVLVHRVVRWDHLTRTRVLLWRVSNGLPTVIRSRGIVGSWLWLAWRRLLLVVGLRLVARVTVLLAQMLALVIAVLLLLLLMRI